MQSENEEFLRLEYSNMSSYSLPSVTQLLFLMKIDRNIISSFNIIFLLCARVGWCDVCTDFTNVIKVDDVNNSDAKARLKRQKSPETTTDTQGMSKFY